MTDGRYDSRRGQFDPRGRGQDQYDRQSERPSGDDRGFIDRARDEVSSWFGDDEAERRRERDLGSDDRGMNEQSYDRYERRPRYRDEGYRRPYTGRPAQSSSGSAGERNWDRGTSQSGPSGASTERHDPDYSQWRSRQIDELDRDYEDFRRENQTRFDREFTSWRGERQAKRQLLGTVTEHMDVVGSDDQPVGKVDWVKGDKIVLAKSDSADGRHHAISCSMVERIEDNKVILGQTADEAKRTFAREGRDPAMTEREQEQNRDSGPHMLNRSFSGTY